ncbi:MAG: hypothetical protein JRI80_02255 [Deltaproteobacteria bacterium]|nr:hypothetical protein [Deltaproteobacteria bacterium]
MKKRLLRIVGLILLITLGAFWGCSSTHSLLKRIRSSEPLLAKRIKVIPFLDETHLGGNLGNAFTAEFISKIRKIPFVILDEKPFGLSMPDNMKSPRFGIVTPKNFIRKAEERGLNILITGVLNPVDVTMKRTGIWPFRKNTRFYEISVVVNLIDVSTGAVLFTRLETRKFSGSEEEYADNDKEFMAELIKDHLPEILKKQVSAITEVLEGIPWIGKVLSAEDKAIRVNGGRDVGIKKGDVFQVFSYEKWINSMSGRPYPVRSQRVGEIEIVSVDDHEAVARPLSGGAFTIGQVILLKH